MKRVIITGATGFLGSWVIRKFLAQGIEIYAVVRDGMSAAKKLPDNKRLHIICCEAEKYACLPQCITERGFNCFIHLAWDGSTGTDRGNYSLQLRNVAETVLAIETAGKLGCRRFLGAGTLAELDCIDYIPWEDSNPALVSCYATAKVTARFMGKAVCAAAGMEFVWAYLPNTYGEGNRTANFVNFAVLRMLRGERSSFTAGEQLYEFVYAEDTAAGIYAIAEKGKAGHAYYIGGNPKPLKEYIHEIRDSVDPAIPLYLGEVPLQGSMQTGEVFDGSLLEKDTGFAVQIPFSNGIQKTVSWLKTELEMGGFE